MVGAPEEQGRSRAMKHIHVTTWEPQNVQEVRLNGSLVKWKVGRVSLIWEENRPQKKPKRTTIHPGTAHKRGL
jgi:hypothetical protein